MKKVVLIDDEGDLTSLMSDVLVNTGLYEVMIARDGQEGQELCVKEKPDMIFLDYVMPKIKGNQVLRFLRNRPETKDIPVIIMSGLGGNVYFKDNQDWQAMARKNLVVHEKDGVVWEKSCPELVRESGVYAFLPKPFYGETLLKVTGMFMSPDREDNSETA